MRRMQLLLTMLATMGTLCPSIVLADETKPAVRKSPAAIGFAYEVRDVAVDARGMMHARVLSASGAPLAKQVVRLRRANETIATALSESSGDVSFAGLESGLYELNLAASVQYVRVWARGTAPPVAIKRLMLVQGVDVQRAQNDFCSQLLGREPIMIGVLMAAGIAIPLAVHESGS